MAKFFATLADASTLHDETLLNIARHEVAHLVAGNPSTLFEQLLTDYPDAVAQAFAAIIRDELRPKLPRPAEDMTWAEIDADMDAGRECLAMTKARVMIQAGEAHQKEACAVLAKLRAPMATHGFIPAGPTLDSEGNVRTVEPDRPTTTQLWERVHEGLLLELAAAGVVVDG